MKVKKKYTFDLQAIQNQIGKRIKALRIQMGMVQNDLAELLCVNRSTVSGIEKGRIAPTLPHMLIISKTFDKSLDYIVKGKGAESVPDFKEMTQEILDMLDVLQNNPVMLHSVLSSYYQIKLNYPPDTKKNENQGIKT